MRRPPFSVRLIMAPDDTYRVGLTIGTDTFALTQDEADMLAYLLQRGKPRSAMDPAVLHEVMDRLGWPKAGAPGHVKQAEHPAPTGTGWTHDDNGDPYDVPTCPYCEEACWQTCSAAEFSFRHGLPAPLADRIANSVTPYAPDRS